MKPFHLARAGALLAINLLFLMLWGFAGLGKLTAGKPDWFGDKFGKTILASFPGLTATFWLLAAAETLGLALVLIALLRGEFLRLRPPEWLTAGLVWSLFVFAMLAFGQWLTKDFVGAFQICAYFGVTLVALQYVSKAFDPSGNDGPPR
jgi:hypothetical protein